MRFTFEPDQRLFAETTREFLTSECSPAAVREAWSSESGCSLERWKKLAAMGVIGLTAPERHGGLGMDELALVLLLEESGRAALPEPIVETVAVGVPMIIESGDDELGDRWLGVVATGDALVTVGLSSQPFVADAHLADLLLLQHGSDLHAVTAAQVTLTAQPSMDGSRRLSTVGWTPSPATLLAGGPPATELIARAFDRGALAVAAQLLGVSQQLIELTAEYARERHQFGKPIGSFQAVKHHLADALLAVELARPVVYRAAWSVARHEPTRGVDVSMAKAYASEAGDLAARVALQVHGAIGYTWECDAHLWMKRAWALAASWGDARWHRRRIASVILAH
jgi:alkylation response protein AidB-like acyl-CoA dehydrogenase